MRKLMFISLALVVAILAIPASAEEAFTVTALDAADVDCLSVCHAENPHKIHAGRPVSCVDCHGENLAIAIPQCGNCHNGAIHTVHKGKVATEDCSYCHQGLEGVHNAALSESVCAHCHKDLILDHGGEVESCTKCHRTAPDIVKPVETAEMDIVCQACHASDSVASVHGNESNIQACYDCHRPGEDDVSATQVPHNIHIPAVSCVACHMDNEIVIVPECIRCHQISDLHTFDAVGTKSKDDMKCSACHPKSYFTSGETVATEVPDTTSEVEEPVVYDSEAEEPELYDSEEEEDESSSTPGFGFVSAIGAIAALYFVSRRK
ncbi:MAG TPA: hypothetical protein C5S50_09325 [Methanosarcinaceae archaeon]|nr:hypothetical protein [Methanosarcinaceae archaeon]